MKSPISGPSMQSAVVVDSQQCNTWQSNDNCFLGLIVSCCGIDGWVERFRVYQFTKSFGWWSALRSNRWMEKLLGQNFGRGSLRWNKILTSHTNLAQKKLKLETATHPLKGDLLLRKKTRSTRRLNIGIRSGGCWEGVMEVEKTRIVPEGRGGRGVSICREDWRGLHDSRRYAGSGGGGGRGGGSSSGGDGGGGPRITLRWSVTSHVGWDGVGALSPFLEGLHHKMCLRLGIQSPKCPLAWLLLPSRDADEVAVQREIVTDRVLSEREELVEHRSYIFERQKSIFWNSEFKSTRNVNAMNPNFFEWLRSQFRSHNMASVTSESKLLPKNGSPQGKGGILKRSGCMRPLEWVTSGLCINKDAQIADLHLAYSFNRLKSSLAL